MDLVLFFYTLIHSSYAEFCSYRNKIGYSYYVTGYMYCHDDCCGSYYYRYCCYHMPGGTIAGAVIGALVVIGVVVGIVVFVCIKNKRGVRGRVIAPQPTTGVSVIHSSHTHTMPVQQINYGYQPPPPGYQQPMAGYSQPPAAYPPPPPQYSTGPTGGTNPAYPPPPPPSYPAGSSAPQHFGFSNGPPAGYPQKS